ncbi:hypothetical protein [Candidatus Nitrosotenuis cloacae]|nr:hypothetical protein [Candidatus Nitrosotenuis cloacae]
MSLDKSNKQTLVTCQRCKEQTSLSDLDATLYRENWYHLSCWKALVGKF